MSAHVGKFTLTPCSRCGKPNLVLSWNWLRWRREQAKLSLREVARQLNLSAPYISDIERGRRACTKPILKFYEAL